VSNDGHKAAERALEVLVYAPVGLAMYLRDTVPTFLNLFVSRGRSEIVQRKHQAEGQVSQAKALGEYAIGFGAPRVREQVEKGIAVALKGAEAVLGGVGEGGGPGPQPATSTTTQPSAPPVRPVEEEAGREEEGAKPSATTLGIPDYDELSASQVVERLDGLQPSELEAVRDYEEGHRARRTILFKIEQLNN
jgi:hypothetical protein